MPVFAPSILPRGVFPDIQLRRGIEEEPGWHIRNAVVEVLYPNL